MSYAVYGKRSAWRNTETNRMEDPDKTFRALNGYGERVTRLSDAIVFYTKEDAEEWVNSHKFRPEATIEIRKIKD